MNLNDAIKKEFGEKFKQARTGNRLSRAQLSKLIKVSAKTIQSWEIGRTFPENMALIPVIEQRMGFFIPDILAQTVREVEKKYAKTEESPEENTEEPKEEKIVRRAAVVDEKPVEKEEQSQPEEEETPEVDEV